MAETEEKLTIPTTDLTVFQAGWVIPSMSHFWRVLAEGKTQLAWDLASVLVAATEESEAKAAAVEYISGVKRKEVEMKHNVRLSMLLTECLRDDGVIGKKVTSTSHVPYDEEWEAAFAKCK